MLSSKLKKVILVMRDQLENSFAVFRDNVTAALALPARISLILIVPITTSASALIAHLFQLG
jgi:hypothetical protein